MFYTVGEVAELLNVPNAQAYILCKSKDFPAKKIGRHWRISKPGFEKWVATF